MTGLHAAWGREARAAPGGRPRPDTAPARIVRLPLAGGAGRLLEAVAIPAVGDAGADGHPRLASLPDPADSRGALFVLVEGIPAATAAVFHRTVRRAFADDRGTQ